jgi:transmembrane protein EpsG
MIIYYSMIIWIVVLTIIYKSSVQTVRLKTGERVIPLPYAVLSMGYIVFWVSLRSGIADTRAYVEGFETLPVGINYAKEMIGADVKDWGFYSLSVLWKTLVSDNYHYWLTIIAVCSGIPIMRTLRRKSADFMWSMLLFMLMLHFTWLINGMRQFLAAAIMFGCCQYIEKRKMVKFFIVVVLCSLIHKTALIMIPLYFFFIEKPFSKRMWLFVLCILASVFAVAPMVEAMGDALQGSQYESNLQQFAEDDGVHPLRVIVMAIPGLLAFLRRKQIARLDNALLNISINMSVIAWGFYFIGMLTSGIMIGRLSIYFELYNLILLPYLVKVVYRDNSNLIYWGATIGYAAFFYVLYGTGYYVSDLTGFVK